MRFSKLKLEVEEVKIVINLQKRLSWLKWNKCKEEFQEINMGKMYYVEEIEGLKRGQIFSRDDKIINWDNCLKEIEAVKMG